MGDRLTLTAFVEALREEDYPVSGDRLRDRYEDHVLDLAGGEEPLSEVFARGGSSDTYADAADVLADVYNGITVTGIGRPNYTDRGGVAGPDRHWSF